MLVWLLISSSALAEERNVIAAAELSGLFQIGDKGNEPTGVYYHLLSQILSETDLAQRYQVVVMPMKRTKASFLQGSFACYSPGVATFAQAERNLLPPDLLSSQAFNMALVRVFPIGLFSLLLIMCVYVGMFGQGWVQYSLSDDFMLYKKLKEKYKWRF